MRRLLGEIGQWLGAVGTIGGTYVQIKDNASWVVVVVMVAAFAWGIATKVKYYGGKARALNRRSTDQLR